MRRTAMGLILLGGVALLASPALAVNIFFDPFAYPPGNLVPNGGWATHSGTGTDIQVLAGGFIEGSTANTPDDNKAWSTPAPDSTSKVYACFKVRIPTPTTTPTATGYFAHFKDTGTLNFRAKVFIIPSAPAFTFGISVSSNTATPWTSVLSYDTWYVVATCYDPHARKATMWVNPASEASPSVSVTELATVNIITSAYAFRQASVAGGSWKWDVDDLGVATAFIDACEAPVPVEQSTWGQIKSMYH